jgi:hypothetical protein
MTIKIDTYDPGQALEACAAQLAMLRDFLIAGGEELVLSPYGAVGISETLGCLHRAILQVQRAIAVPVGTA